MTSQLPHTTSININDAIHHSFYLVKITLSIKAGNNGSREQKLSENVLQRFHTEFTFLQDVVRK